MKMTVKHLQDRNGTFYFRRRVPGDVRAKVGQSEWSHSLGRDKVAAIRACTSMSASTDQIIAAMRRNEGEGETTLALHRQAATDLEALGLDPRSSAATDASADMSNREVLIDQIANDIERRVIAKYGLKLSEEEFDSRRDDEATPREKARLAVLAGEAPEVSLRAALEAYLTYRYGQDHAADKRSHKATYAVRKFLEFKGVTDIPLANIVRANTRDFRDDVFDRQGLSEETFNSIKRPLSALTNYAIRELDADVGDNPWAHLRLSPPQREQARTRGQPRAPFTAADYATIFAELEASKSQPAAKRLNDDARRIMVITLLTGGRQQDARGLAVSDLRLDDDVPHIVAEHRPWRPLKNDPSERKVPLVGKALQAAREALAAAEGRPADSPLFPRYVQEGGLAQGKDPAAALSMATNKWLKRRKLGPGKSLHSARHSAEDWFRNAGVNPELASRFVGHLTPGISYRYGGGFSLPVLQNAWTKALRMAGVPWE